jgi:transposase
MSCVPLFVGIDVAKDTLDVAVRPTAETWQVANDAAGISALVEQM